jgi:hypothetical protein
MNETAACKSVLIEVLTILAKDLDNIVVVGGWVPELAFPNKGHIGSLDVDLALDAEKLKPLAYESIRKKLVDAGYQQSSDIPNRFYRDIQGTSIQVKVDLITGAFSDVATEDTHLLIQEMAVWKARGVDLAFAFQREVSVEGVLPDGGHNRVTARMPIIAAYLCIKAITLSERKKEKDAYDICFCIENYPGGYKALAEEFQGKLENALIAEGIKILQEKFERLDSIGPVWAAQTAEEATAGTGTNLDLEQRRAFELVNALLRQINDSKSRSISISTLK